MSTSATSSTHHTNRQFHYNDSDDGDDDVDNDFEPVQGFSDDPLSVMKTMRTDGMKANLALLVETGVCRVMGSASLVCLPSTTTNTSSSSSQQQQHTQHLDPLPQSARDIYFRNSSQQQQQQHQGPGARDSRQPGNPSDAFFLDDNWFFVELHQSILQESSQRS